MTTPSNGDQPYVNIDGRTYQPGQRINIGGQTQVIDRIDSAGNIHSHADTTNWTPNANTSGGSSAVANREEIEILQTREPTYKDIESINAMGYAYTGRNGANIRLTPIEKIRDSVNMNYDTVHDVPAVSYIDNQGQRQTIPFKTQRDAAIFAQKVYSEKIGSATTITSTQVPVKINYTMNRQGEGNIAMEGNIPQFDIVSNEPSVTTVTKVDMGETYKPGIYGPQRRPSTTIPNENIINPSASANQNALIQAGNEAVVVSEYTKMKQNATFNPLNPFQVIGSTAIPATQVLATPSGTDYLFANETEKLRMEAMTDKKLREDPMGFVVESKDSLIGRAAQGVAIGTGIGLLGAGVAAVGVPTVSTAFDAALLAGGAYYLGETGISLASDVQQGNVSAIVKDASMVGADLAGVGLGLTTSKAVLKSDVLRAAKEKIYRTTDYSISVPLENTVITKGIKLGENSGLDNVLDFKTNAPGVKIRKTEGLLGRFFPESIVSTSTGTTTGRITLMGEEVPGKASEASVNSATSIIEATLGDQPGFKQRTYISSLPTIKTAEIPRINMLEGMEAPAYPRKTVSTGSGGIFKIDKGAITGFDLKTLSVRETVGGKKVNAGASPLENAEIPITLEAGKGTDIAQATRVFSTNTARVPKTRTVSGKGYRFGDIIPEVTLRTTSGGRISEIELIELRTGKGQTRQMPTGQVRKHPRGFNYDPNNLQGVNIADLRGGGRITKPDTGFNGINLFGDAKPSGGGTVQIELGATKLRQRPVGRSEPGIIDQLVSGMETKKIRPSQRTVSRPYNPMEIPAMGMGAVTLMGSKNRMITAQRSRQSQTQYNPMNLLNLQGQGQKQNQKNRLKQSGSYGFEGLLGLKQRQSEKISYVTPTKTITQPAQINIPFVPFVPDINEPRPGKGFVPIVGGMLGEGYANGARTKQTSRKRKLVELII